YLLSSPIHPLFLYCLSSFFHHNQCHTRLVLSEDGGQEREHRSFRRWRRKIRDTQEDFSCWNAVLFVVRLSHGAASLLPDGRGRLFCRSRPTLIRCDPQLLPSATLRPAVGGLSAQGSRPTRHAHAGGRILSTGPVEGAGYMSATVLQRKKRYRIH
ncbi:hypothetical protein PENTCL1PPCAC_29609, partial [Pristionchus entomophagus]